MDVPQPLVPRLEARGIRFLPRKEALQAAEADPTPRLLIPNAHSRALRILGVQTPTLHPRGHINLCTKESFALLAQKAGLRIERRFQELPVIDLMHPFISFSEELVREIVAAEEAYYDVYLLRRA